MEIWHYWLVFLGTAALALLVVSRLDHGERREATQARKTEDEAGK